MDVLLARKLGVPGQEELAFGAIAIGGVQVLDPVLISELRLPPEAIERAVAEQTQVLESRNLLYRKGRPAPCVQNQIAIVVDDGIATGSTMRAAVRALRSQGPSRIVVAAPVASVEAVVMLQREADEVVCRAAPNPFRAVGYWYQDFRQVTDDEVRWLLEKSARVPAA
jgi:putative phosphoribosyl transferase